VKAKSRGLAFAVIGFAAALGYAAAAGKFHSDRLAAARPQAEDKAAPETLDRTVLPIPEAKREPITTLDARNAKAPPRFEVTAPRGGPNVVIVLLDDMGYGQPRTFGGACAMPTLDRLAAGGLRYSDLHVTALCSPTRAALLTGRNHHTCNLGAVEPPRRSAPAAELTTRHGTPFTLPTTHPPSPAPTGLASTHSRLHWPGTIASGHAKPPAIFPPPPPGQAPSPPQHQPATLTASVNRQLAAALPSRAGQCAVPVGPHPAR
jgi:Sulfatase